jgi:exopolysaccharide production protein ExoZ
VIQNIQILRFVAALGVVLFHTLVPLVVPQVYQPTLPEFLHKVFQLGFAGVDLFFVISGAVIAESTRGLPATGASRCRFMAVRLCRIYAGWWPFFLLYLLAYPLWGWTLEGKRIASSFFLVPLTDVVSYTLPILWTLSMEIYFYVVVGFLLVLPRAKLHRALLVWAAIVLAVVLYDLATGRYQAGNYRKLSVFRMYFASPFVLEFIAGFLLCELARARPAMARWPWAAAALVFAAAGAWMHLEGGLGYFGLAEFVHAPTRVLTFGGAACALVVCAMLWRPSQGRFTTMLARLGDASYALYLSHILVLVTLYLCAVALGVPATMRAPLYLAAVAATAAFAWLHYRWIEHPLYTASRRRIEKALA